jgi:hypothetical protein
MKKCPIAIVLMLSLLLLLCSPASADTITAMAIEINPEHLEKTASYARILGYNADSNTLTVELIAPEVFNRADILALKPGDTIWSNGQEITIATIKYGEDNLWVIINDWETEYVGQTLQLEADNNKNFVPVDMDNGNYTWRTFAVLDIPVSKSLLLLDYFDESQGKTVFLPIVRTVDEFLSMQRDGELYGFNGDNVYVVFDGEGNLATIHRYYVPWQ